MTINSMTNDKMQLSMIRLSTGNKINSASDDAAGLAISEKIQALSNGYDKGIENTEDMKNLLNTADSGLSGISDQLSRIKELGIQASSGILTDDDKSLIQEEVSQLLQGIQQSAKGTEFNTMKLLDGNFIDKNTASNPSGNGMQIRIENSTLETLGIKDFDVTGDFDLSKIDDALDKVNSSRSSIGASSNRMDYTISSNQTANLNLQEANSRIRDTDMAREISDYKKEQILNQYKIQMQKKGMGNMMANALNLFS